MVTSDAFDADRQGRQFGDVYHNKKLLAEAVYDVVNDPNARLRMEIVTVHLGLPALAGITRELEQQPEVRKFFDRTNRGDTLRFRQFVGVAVRLAMEEVTFVTTGRKGYLATFSSFFTRAELFAPPPRHPGRKIWEAAQEQAPPEKQKERRSKAG